MSTDFAARIQKVTNDHGDVFNLPDYHYPDCPDELFFPTSIPPSKFEDSSAKLMSALGKLYHLPPRAALTTTEPIVRALETGAFALPATGVFLSAGIGLLWSMLQPGSITQYQTPMKEMMSGIVDSSLSSQKLREARSSLEQFNGSLHDAISSARLEQDEDVDHIKATANEFKGYLSPKGLLIQAWYDIKDNLPWFDASGQMLLVAATHGIIQAFKVRMMCWQAIAIHMRNRNDIPEYNKAQYEVISLLDQLSNQTEQLSLALHSRLEGMIKARFDGAEAQFDWQGANNTVDHRQHVAATYKVRGFVLDGVTERRNFETTIKPTSVGSKLFDFVTVIASVGSAGSNALVSRADGNNDDAHFDEILGVARDWYKAAGCVKKFTEPLTGGFSKPLSPVWNGVTKMLGQTRQLVTRRTPGDIKHPPRVVANGQSVEVEFEAITSLNVGEKVSFRFMLFAEDSDKELARSSWSDFIEIKKEAEIPQMYIGDGFAQLQTVRKIWVKTSSQNDSDGQLVATIKGFGVMTFPASVATSQD